MNKEIQARWTKRLRNGEIWQGMGNLGLTSGERCCLGVLCDIAVEDGIINPPEGNDVLVYGGYTDLPPSVVYRWAGFDGGFAQHLAIRNDGGATFAEIADLIDAEEE